MGSLPSGTVTFLFTDIEGSTQLWERYPEAMRQALAGHDAILRDSIESYHGSIIKTTGDGFHAVFEKAIDALHATLAAQRKLKAPICDLEIKVRMGLHTGEAELRAGENVIHQTRVAVRRLRSTIRVLSELFDPSEAAHLEEGLVWWAGLLGAVRDMDILAQRQVALLDELPAELILGPVASTIQAEIAVQRKQAMDAMLEALDSERYRRFIGLIHHWRATPDGRSRIATRHTAVIQRRIRPPDNLPV